jgi:hypothetical protein
VTDRWELAARLAALHDRDLEDRDDADDVDDPEGEAVRRDLAAAGDDVLSAYAVAVAIAREHREEDALAGAAPSTPVAPGGTPVTPLRPSERKGGWRRPPARWLALAAVLAAVALIPFLRRGSSPADAERFALLLEERDLPDGWLDQPPPWGVTRGGGEVAADTALAVRVGTLLLKLELAVASRDREATARLAGEVNARLEEAPGSVMVAASYREIERRAGEPAAVLEELLEDGREGVGEILGPELVALGSWGEAARIAAFQRDAGFFESRETRKMLDDLTGDPSLDPAIRAPVGRVQAALPSGRAPDWPTLATALEEMVGAMGR